MKLNIIKYRLKQKISNNSVFSSNRAIKTQINFFIFYQLNWVKKNVLTQFEVTQKIYFLCFLFKFFYIQKFIQKYRKYLIKIQKTFQQDQMNDRIYDQNNPNTMSEFLKQKNLFSQVITEHPEQDEYQADKLSQNLNSEGSRKGLVHRQSMALLQDLQVNYFKLLTNSQKAIQIQNIYNSSKINMFMIELRRIIQNCKLQISEFYTKNPQRQTQLRVYITKLDQVNQMLKFSLGTNQCIKVYVVKKVIEILKATGKIQSKQEYERLMNDINNIAGYKEQNVIRNQMPVEVKQERVQQHVRILNPDSNYSFEIEQRFGNPMTLLPEYKPTSQQIQDQQQEGQQKTSMINSSQQDLEQILQKVDLIQTNHLETWQKHNEQMRQIDQLRKQIKQRSTIFHDRMSLNRKLQYRSRSVKQTPKRQLQIQKHKLITNEQDDLIQNYSQVLTNNLASSPSSLNSVSQKQHKNLIKPKKLNKLKLETLQYEGKNYPKLRSRLGQKKSLPRFSQSRKNEQDQQEHQERSVKSRQKALFERQIQRSTSQHKDSLNKQNKMLKSTNKMSLGNFSSIRKFITSSSQGRVVKSFTTYKTKLKLKSGLNKNTHKLKITR